MLRHRNFLIDLSQMESHVRMSQWLAWHQQIFGDCIVPQDFSSHEIQGRADLRGFGLGSLIKINPASERIVKYKKKGRDENFTIILQTCGSSKIYGLAEELVLQTNDIAFVANREIEKKISPASEMILLNIPMPLVLSRQPHVQALVGSKLEGSKPEINLLRHAICGAYDVLPKISTAQQSNLLLSIVELLGLPEREHDGNAKYEKKLDDALRCIEMHLGDPEFCAEMLADAVHISRRRLDEIFVAALAKPVAGYIWERRLERAAQYLSDHSKNSRSITDVAFSNGFSDISHFSRTFKKKYGLTPSAYQKNKP